MEQNYTPIISVIVPVYNCEKFLYECLDSIINQSFKDLEIIIIDDGSTDNSSEICDNFAKNRKNVIVIHQENSGVSSARNKGINIANGKYIAFVDADDVLPLNAYENLINSIKDYDLIQGSMQLISETGDIIKNNNKFQTIFVSKHDFIVDLFEEKNFPYLGYTTDKIFINNIIKKHRIRFDENIKLNEDRLFVLQYLKYCETIVFNNEIVYKYRQRSSGVILETRRNSTITDSEMTVIQSFEKMKLICKEYSNDMYFICSRKAFESALDLLNRASKFDYSKRLIIIKFLWNNGLVCLLNPNTSIYEKFKILLHAMIMK